MEKILCIFFAVQLVKSIFCLGYGAYSVCISQMWIMRTQVGDEVKEDWEKDKNEKEQKTTTNLVC